MQPGVVQASSFQAPSPRCFLLCQASCPALHPMTSLLCSIITCGHHNILPKLLDPEGSGLFCHNNPQFMFHLPSSDGAADIHHQEKKKKTL